MITILHGDDTDNSRKAFQMLKDSLVGKDIRELSFPQSSYDELVAIVESPSMFGGSVAVIIENLLSSLGRKKKTADAIVERLIASANDQSVILWEGKEIGKELLSKFPKTIATVTLYDFPKTLFSLLDSLKPGNAKETLELFVTARTTEAPELLYAMISSRIRQLIMIKDGIAPERVAPWQLGRLTNQSRLFTMDKLIGIHSALLSSDVSVKSGTSPLSIGDRVEQILLAL
jgi:DNA polymerase III delta subunit